MRYPRRRRPVGAALLWVAAWTGLLCGLVGQPAEAQTRLRIALQDDPDTLDPAANWSFVGRHVLQSLCDKLVDIDQEARIVPMLAESWAWAEDGKSLRIRIRAGAAFHDGAPVDAEAVRYTLRRNLDLPTSRRKAEIDVIDRVDVVDARELELRLKQPSVPLLAALSDRAGMIVSPKAAEAAGEGFGQKPVCAGAYQFVERVAQDRIEIERFPQHWRAQDYSIDRLVFVPIPDSTVRFNNLRARDLDLIERLAPTDVATAAADPTLQVADVSSLGYYSITFNVANGAGVNAAFAKPAVREAFELAIDRTIINEVAFEGRYEAGNQPFPPGSSWFDAKKPVPQRDLAAARARLAEAGYAEVSLDLLVPTDPQRQQVAQIIQAMVGEAGIRLNIVTQELISILEAGRQGQFQAHLAGWSGRVDPDLNITPMLACGAAGNDGRYCNEAIDAKLAEARAIADPEARRAKYAEITDILLAERPQIYLYHAKWIFAHKSALTGFRTYPDGIIRMDGVRLGG